MHKRERVDAALRGDPVDRVPVSFWGHDYLREWSPEGLAGATLTNYRTYDWDYVKVNPRASYHVEDWGCKLRPSGNPLSGPTFIEIAVKEPGDWRRLRPLEPDRGALGEQLTALHMIAQDLKDEVYFMQTIFNPLSVARYLVGNQTQPIITSIEDNPGALLSALEVITQTFATYAQACLEAGASGIFFATTGWASTDLLTEDQYRRFGIEFDLRVLEAAQKGAQLNVLHNCGSHIMFDLLADYPVHAISWAATLPGNPNLAAGKDRTRKAVMGGISEKTTLRNGPPEAVADEARRAIEMTAGRRLLLAPGCSIPPDTPRENLEAIVQVVRG
jgi:uroporphyrinogen decarboxylase